MTVRPDSRFIHLWGLARVLVSFYMGVQMPYRAGFNYQPDTHSWMLLFDVVIEPFLIIDILVSMRTQYAGPDGDMIHDPKLIAKEWAKANGPVDVVSAIPVAFLSLWAVGWEYWWVVLRLNAGARLLRVYRRLATMEQLIYRSVFSLFFCDFQSENTEIFPFFVHFVKK